MQDSVDHSVSHCVSKQKSAFSPFTVGLIRHMLPLIRYCLVTNWQRAAEWTCAYTLMRTHTHTHTCVSAQWLPPLIIKKI